LARQKIQTPVAVDDAEVLRRGTRLPAATKATWLAIVNTIVMVEQWQSRPD
jgi:hypothetical protein